MSRDVYRPKTPPKGVAEQIAAPEPIWDDVTGQYEGDERAAMRARRPTHERLSRLERKQDDQGEAMRRLELAVERVCGKLEAYVDTVKQERAEEAKTERVRLNTRAKVIIGVVTALATAAGAIAAATIGGCS